MKKRIYALCLVFLLLPVLVAEAARFHRQDEPPPPPAPDYNTAKWKETVSAEGKFAVKFPGQPKETSNDYDSNKGKLTLHSLWYGNASFIFYSADYRDYPEAPANSSAVKKILDEVRDNRLMGLEGKMRLLTDKTIERDGHPGRFLEFEYLGTKRLRELDIISGRRHYTVIVITFSNHAGKAMQAENAYEKIANSFLDSFHITSFDAHASVH